MINNQILCFLVIALVSINALVDNSRECSQIGQELCVNQCSCSSELKICTADYKWSTTILPSKNKSNS